MGFGQFSTFLDGNRRFGHRVRPFRIDIDTIHTASPRSIHPRHPDLPISTFNFPIFPTPKSWGRMVPDHGHGHGHGHGHDHAHRKSVEFLTENGFDFSKKICCFFYEILLFMNIKRCGPPVRFISTWWRAEMHLNFARCR